MGGGWLRGGALSQSDEKIGEKNGSGESAGRRLPLISMREARAKEPGLDALSLAEAVKHEGLHIALIAANHRVELGPAIVALREAFGSKLTVRRLEGREHELMHELLSDGAPPSGPLLTVGAGGFAYSLPQLSILLTAHEPELRWSGVARALRARIGLIVPEITPSLAAALEAQWGDSKSSR